MALETNCNPNLALAVHFATSAPPARLGHHVLPERVVNRAPGDRAAWGES